MTKKFFTVSNCRVCPFLSTTEKSCQYDQKLGFSQINVRKEIHPACPLQDIPDTILQYSNQIMNRFQSRLLSLTNSGFKTKESLIHCEGNSINVILIYNSSVIIEGQELCYCPKEGLPEEIQSIIDD